MRRSLGSVDEVPSLSVPSLSDTDVALRRWRVEDADAKLAAFTDPLFLRSSDWAPTTREEVVRRVVEVERLRRAGAGLHLAVVDLMHPDTVLGEVSLTGIDRAQGRASVGYWLTATARGRGVATRAVRLLTGWALAELPLARLELTCGPDNEASQGVALRSGFRREGLLRSHVRFKGGRRDSLVFGLLPSDLTD